MVSRLLTLFMPEPEDSSFVKTLKKAICDDLATSFNNGSIKELLEEAAALDP